MGRGHQDWIEVTPCDFRDQRRAKRHADFQRSQVRHGTGQLDAPRTFVACRISAVTISRAAADLDETPVCLRRELE